VHPHWDELSFCSKFKLFIRYCAQCIKWNQLEMLIVLFTAMRTETSFIACTSRCKAITATAVLAINKAHELSRSVAMIILRNVVPQLDYNAEVT
jgi:hypothetical protein